MIQTSVRCASRPTRVRVYAIRRPSGENCADLMSKGPNSQLNGVAPVFVDNEQMNLMIEVVSDTICLIWEAPNDTGHLPLAGSPRSLFAEGSTSCFAVNSSFSPSGDHSTE